MLRHIKDVLNEDVGLPQGQLLYCTLICPSQSCLLVIDTVIQDGVLAKSGPSLSESLSTQTGNIYKSVLPPPLIPSDFGEASRMQHQVNVALTALCNCEYSKWVGLPWTLILYTAYSL